MPLERARAGNKGRRRVPTAANGKPGNATPSTTFYRQRTQGRDVTGPIHWRTHRVASARGDLRPRAGCLGPKLKATGMSPSRPQGCVHGVLRTEASRPRPCENAGRRALLKKVVHTYVRNSFRARVRLHGNPEPNAPNRLYFIDRPRRICLVSRIGPRFSAGFSTLRPPLSALE